MALVKLKPTSPGRRGTVRVVNPDLHKGEPHKALLESKRAINGRNNVGRITVRHRGGGHKRKYRVIDFRRKSKRAFSTIVVRRRRTSLHYCPERHQGGR